MSLDAMVVYRAGQRWRDDHKFIYLPKHPAYPVVWVTHDGCMRMYHPALSLDRMNTAPGDWTREGFANALRELLPVAAGLVVDELQAGGMPMSFYSNYPAEAARASATQPADSNDIPQPEIDQEAL